MTNYELIRKFKDGATKGIAGHLYIKGDELINYSTVIAYRDENGKFHLNTQYYSRTTSKIQNYCKTLLDTDIVEEYEGSRTYLWNAGYMGAPTIKAKDVY